jgi:hypothetical protein
MELTAALLSALRAHADASIKSVQQTSPTRIVITHVSGSQIAVDAMALGPHIQCDPARLEAEAKGALAALARMAAQTPPREGAVHALIVPVLRPLSWLAAANAQTGRDLHADGLAFPFGGALIVAYAIEHDDRRVPVLEPADLKGLTRDQVLQTALANQRRMQEAGDAQLIVTDLHMGDGTFFLRSKNLQAASLILQPAIWRLIDRVAPSPPKAVLATIVSADAILFGPSQTGSRDEDAQMLRSAQTGLRKSLGGADWGTDVFHFPSGVQLPQAVA